MSSTRMGKPMWHKRLQPKWKRRQLLERAADLDLAAENCFEVFPFDFTHENIIYGGLGGEDADAFWRGCSDCNECNMPGALKPHIVLNVEVQKEYDQQDADDWHAATEEYLAAGIVSADLSNHVLYARAPGEEPGAFLFIEDTLLEQLARHGFQIVDGKLRHVRPKRTRDVPMKRYFQLED